MVGECERFTQGRVRCGQTYGRFCNITEKYCRNETKRDPEEPDRLGISRTFVPKEIP